MIFEIDTTDRSYYYLPVKRDLHAHQRIVDRALSIAHEIEDDQLEPLRRHAESRYEPRFDAPVAEFAFWFALNEPHPRGQWNNAIMPAFIGSPGTWRRAFEQELRRGPTVEHR